MQDIFYFESGAAERKSYTFPRSWRKLSVISVLLEEFRRLNAILIAFYTPNVVHAVFSFETGTAARNRNDLLDFDENWALFLFCWRNFDV